MLGTLIDGLLGGLLGGLGNAAVAKVTSYAKETFGIDIKTSEASRLTPEQIIKIQEYANTLALAEVELLKGQLEVNKTEAASEDKFTSRWRPLVGYICGVALGYSTMIQPFLIFVCRANGLSFEVPEMDGEQLLTVLMSMLGIGAMRSYDKKIHTLATG